MMPPEHINLRELEAFNVPTKGEFDKLSRRVGELEAAAKRRSTTMTAAPQKRRKSARS